MNNQKPWVDEKYTLMLDRYVDRFKVVQRNPLTVNFRCPICGDSASSRTKARGFVYRNKSGGCSYKCHNCGDTRSLGRLLKEAIPVLYKDYVLERYRGDGWSFDVKKDRTKSNVDATARLRRNPPGELKRLSELNTDHPAVTYWRSRKIPAHAMHEVYWADNYFKWVNDHVVQDKFSAEAVSNGCGRIVFPFRDRDGTITGYTGRAVAGETPKYVAVRATPEETTSAFGIDKVDVSRDILVVEGPIDSLFLNNSVAMGSSSRRVPLEQKVFVFDNEPRNSQLVSIMRRTIDEGERVVVWPEGLAEKDINEMVLAGLDPATIIRENTHRGLRAKLALDAWEKT